MKFDKMRAIEMIEQNTTGSYMTVQRLTLNRALRSAGCEPEAREGQHSTIPPVHPVKKAGNCRKHHSSK